MSEVIGRDALGGGHRVRLVHEGRELVEIQRLEDGEAADLPWVVPGLWDLQVNGCRGISFSNEGLTVGQVRAVCEFVRRDGVSRFCPTLITASPEAMRHGVATIAAACEGDELVRRMVLGIHLEGPAISEVDGYRGAHPREWVRDLEWSELEAVQAASGGRVVLLTLAPERAGSIALIERATAAGIVVALGHTAADGATIAAAVEAGARLSTHLGNGIASPLPRHPNPIFTQAAEDRLLASLIADGRHLGIDVLRVLARAKGVERVILVSDVSPLAGSVPGVYEDWEVTSDGAVVVAGTGYLAGASRPLVEGIGRLAEATGWTIPQCVAAATWNPAQLLGAAPPALASSEDAEWILLNGAGRPIRMGPGFVA